MRVRPPLSVNDAVTIAAHFDALGVLLLLAGRFHRQTEVLVTDETLPGHLHFVHRSPGQDLRGNQQGFNSAVQIVSHWVPRYSTRAGRENITGRSPSEQFKRAKQPAGIQ